jgi:hypothetical protein
MSSSSEGPWSIGRPLIWQPALRTTFSFNFGSYLKTKFDAQLFVHNQMSDLENEVTQYKYESPSPLHPSCSKRQRASGTEDQNYIPEQSVYDNCKLNFPQDQEERALFTQEKQPSPKKRQLRGIRSLNMYYV